MVYDFVTELTTTKQVSDETYARAKKIFNDQQIVDLTALAGNYVMVAMLLAMAEGGTCATGQGRSRSGRREEARTAAASPRSLRRPAVARATARDIEPLRGEQGGEERCTAAAPFNSVCSRLTARSRAVAPASASRRGIARR